MPGRKRQRPVVTTVEGVTRTDAVEALIGVRALLLHVPTRDLRTAIVLTERDRLATLVVVHADAVSPPALACTLRGVS